MNLLVLIDLSAGLISDINSILAGGVSAIVELLSNSLPLPPGPDHIIHFPHCILCEGLSSNFYGAAFELEQDLQVILFWVDGLLRHRPWF